MSDNIFTNAPQVAGLPQIKIIKPEDKVHHPKHYNSHPSGIECIEIARHFNFNIGNAIKYIWRAGLKDSTTTVEDIEKAKWYLQDEINRIQNNYEKK